MKNLLVAINSKYIHSNLAVYSLRAYSKEYAEAITICEYTINQQLDYILQDIYDKRPDTISISCYIWNIEYVQKLTRDISKLMPDTPIWLGGPEVSYRAKQYLEDNPYIKGIMVGEGEITYNGLMRLYNDKQNDESTINVKLRECRGIVYRQDNEIIDNYSYQVMDMNEIVFAYGNSLEQIPVEELNNRIIYYESSRGCPFSCSYCLSSIEKKLRFRALDLVKKELLFFINKKVKQVKFVDRTFNCDKARTTQIWKFILENDNGYTNFHFEIAADILDSEEIELLSHFRKGAIQLEIGVQSINPDTLKAIKRSMDYEVLCQNVLSIKKNNNIKQHLDLIAGLPYEDIGSFKKSFDSVYKVLQPDELQLGFLKVLYGSYMHECIDEYKLVYKSEPPYEVMSTRWLSYEDIIRLKGIEDALENYYNSRQFKASITYIYMLYASAFDMFNDIYEFLKELYKDTKVSCDIKHSRIDNYRLLLAFFESKEANTKKQNILKQLLVHDLYSRENMKSRPEFATDEADFMESIKEFYAREAKTHKYLPEYSEYSYRQLMNITHIERYGINPFAIGKSDFEATEWMYVLYTYGANSYTKIIDVEGIIHE